MAGPRLKIDLQSRPYDAACYASDRFEERMFCRYFVKKHEGIAHGVVINNNHLVVIAGRLDNGWTLRRNHCLPKNNKTD